MDEETAGRIVDAFNVVREGIYPEWHTIGMEIDVTWIKKRYAELKWKKGFGEAMRQAQIEFLCTFC
jgi:hypothetical protein